MSLQNLENLLLAGRYQTGARLCHGSYAEIYRALDTQTQRQVIIKTLNPALRGTPTAGLEQLLLANFQQEAALLRRLQHAHIVQLYAQGTARNAAGVECQFLVLEYLSGGSLSERCRRQPLPLATVLRYFAPVCEALTLAHGYGIVHRDLKPSNLLFTHDRTQLKLIDFGVAKQLQGQPYGDITRVGTEVYSPPEHNPQLPRNEEPLTPAADVYALAKTLYTALAGRAPHEFRRRPITFLPEPLAAQPWGAPLLAILRRATAERVAERYASLDEFWKEFAAVGTSAPAQRQTAQPRGATRPVQRATRPLTERLKAGFSETAARLRRANRIVIELLGTHPDQSATPPPSAARWSLLPRFSAAAGLLLLAWAATLLLQESLSLLFPLPLANTLALLMGLALASAGTLALVWFFKQPPRPPLALSAAAAPSTPLGFTVIQVDARGRLRHRQEKQTSCLREKLAESITLELVFIAGGSFQMGSTEKEAGHSAAEAPLHQVRVPGFWLSRFPITQAQWHSVAQWPTVHSALAAAPAFFQGSGLPVESVSWHEAQEFCARLARQTGRRYRLPTEAEWEYACRAGTQTPFHFGPVITPQLANYDSRLPYGTAAPGAARDRTAPISALSYANDFGLCAMHGNVWEWCADTWHADYQGAPRDGSAWLTEGDDQLRVVRGGAWFNAATLCRSAYRFAAPPESKGNNCGFRLALDL
jgi:formylglycine-generating enzyme required for sulfatase activity/serine/threonine protein kinase